MSWAVSAVISEPEPSASAHLGTLVFRRGDEVGSVGRPLQIGHLHVRLVNFHVVEDKLAGLHDCQYGSLVFELKMRTLASHCDTLPSSCPEMM